MPLDLNEVTARHSAERSSGAPWALLFEAQAPTDPPTRYRFTSFDKIIEYGEDDDGVRLKYYPVPVELSGIDQDGEGGLPTIDISIGLGGPMAAAAVAGAGGFIGQPFRITLVSTLALDDPDPAFSEEAEVVECTISTDLISLRVSAFNLSRAKFPPFAYARKICGFPWGRALCGYNTNAAGAGYALCGVTTGGVVTAEPFSIAACIAVGDDEESNLGARLHPARFGGHPGMRRRGK